MSVLESFVLRENAVCLKVDMTCTHELYLVVFLL